MLKKCFSWVESHVPQISVLTLSVAILTLVVAVWSLHVAIAQREDAQVLGVWNIIAISPQAHGNIGRKEAIEFLFERGENLHQINLLQAYLSEVDLRDADLWNARLEGAEPERARLTGATLTIARLQGAIMRGADLTGAVPQCAQLSRGSAADASGVPFGAADLREATLVGTKFDGTDLTGVGFTGANISDASFLEFDCNLDDRRQTRVTPEQLSVACADPTRSPKVPDRPEFADFQLRECPPG